MTTRISAIDEKSNHHAFEGLGPASLPPECLDILLRANRREGFEAGYRRAVNDVLAATVWLAEQSLLEQADHTPQLRRAVYGFISHLDRSLRQIPAAPSLEGGLGI